MAPVALPDLPQLPDLRDPAPPVAGAPERAAVAVRAEQLVRRRRAMRGVTTLVVVGIVAVGVAALTADGNTTGPDSRPVAAASGSVSSDFSGSTTITGTFTAPATVTVTGHASGVPDGATLTLQLSGTAGTFTAVADADGNYTLDVPPGTYTGAWTWESADHTATSAGRLDDLDITADQDVNFSVTGH